MKKEYTISKGNTKLGNILNYSTVPVKDCGNCSGCKVDCYALKAYRQYKAVRVSWDSNSALMRADRASLTEHVVHMISKKRKPVDKFRVYQAGDVLDQADLDGWIDTAKACPGTQFLLYTKMHGLDFSNVPTNMNIFHSQWVGMPKENKTGLNAWIAGDKRVPEKHMVCPSVPDKETGKLKTTCDKCGYCFAKNVKLDVVFQQH